MRRTEWHRHNLKRKVANLKPLTKEAFEARQAAASSAAEAGAGGKQRRGRGGRDGTAGGAEKERQAAPGSKAAYYQAAAEMTDDELLAARVAAAPELHPGLDLFSPHEAESLEANLAHMAQAYSFTVPYASYVKDVPGLIRYLQEKVYIGCVALVEGKQFHSWQAAQGHMRDKNSQRFNLEGCEDEYAGFYDLQALARDSPDWHEVEVEVDGEEGEEAMTEVVVIYEPAAAAARAEMGADGAAGADSGTSSLFVGGKELGHRALRRYYGQSYATPAPEREAVNRLLLQYRQMGLVGAGPGGGALMNARGLRGGRGGAGPSRADNSNAQRSDLSLGLKRNTLIKKGNHKSQNIVFG
mmetsp:Transcript_2450/g.6972  ORF Transcript_2450/g.6972 Transcript_2450/m.6972 type:complete len:355 (-) Transcript_2450:293-1357(-)